MIERDVTFPDRIQIYRSACGRTICNTLPICVLNGTCRCIRCACCPSAKAIAGRSCKSIICKRLRCTIHKSGFIRHGAGAAISDKVYGITITGILCGCCCCDCRRINRRSPAVIRCTRISKIPLAERIACWRRKCICRKCETRCQQCWIRIVILCCLSIGRCGSGSFPCCIHNAYGTAVDCIICIITCCDFCSAGSRIGRFCRSSIGSPA